MGKYAGKNIIQHSSEKNQRSVTHSSHTYYVDTRRPGVLYLKGKSLSVKNHLINYKLFNNIYINFWYLMKKHEIVDKNSSEIFISLGSSDSLANKHFIEIRLLI